MKNGILAVSFGTSHLDTMEKTICVIEREIAGAFPDRKVYRAFTSGVIIRKLRETKGFEIDTVEEALDRMASDGIRDVLVQPTHMISGIENDRLMEALTGRMDRFERLRTGKPLLGSPDDYRESVRAVMEMAQLAEDEMLILMGHGSEHRANASYLTLEYAFHTEGYPQVIVGTVESEPDLDNVMEKLLLSGKRKAALMPFMLVAGDHAKNDMAGEDDSWKTCLEEAGYEVRVILKGLGESERIRKLFLKHIREAV